MRLETLERIKITIKKIWLTTLKVTVFSHLVFFVLMGFIMMYLNYYNRPTTSLMLYREFICDHDVKPVDFVPLEKIPDDFVKMVISTEDYKFYEHPGIDIEAIKRAYVINMKVGYRMFGGSTITQQISRSLFLLPKKILIRKYFEVLIALQMDAMLPKDRIIELYLNYAEWGNGIFGLSRAAEYHFKKTIKTMNIDQSARLIAILANPIDYSPYNFMGKKLLAYRYFMIKFRYYTYMKFHEM